MGKGFKLLANIYPTLTQVHVVHCRKKERRHDFPSPACVQPQALQLTLLLGVRLRRAVRQVQWQPGTVQTNRFNLPAGIDNISSVVELLRKAC